MSFDLRPPVERDEPCIIPPPNGAGLHCAFPYGHDVHWDGKHELWLNVGPGLLEAAKLLDEEAEHMVEHSDAEALRHGAELLRRRASGNES